MNAIFVSALYGMSGLCLYAALHHAFVAWRRPVDCTQFLFAVMCLVILMYIAAKAGAYQAETAQELVAARRWELLFALVFLAILPWFIAGYTGVRPLWLLNGLSILFAMVFVANLTLPYGISFVELPHFQRLTLPWGEQIADVRVLRRGAWHTAGWLGILVSFGYAIFACVRQYRRGARRMALILALGLVPFIGLTLFNLVVNLGWVQFAHTAEFGIMGLVVAMSFGLTGELRAREQRLQTILDHVPALVFMKDLRGRYLLVNREIEILLGVTHASILGKSDHQLYPATQAADYQANDRQVIETRQALGFNETVILGGKKRTFSSLKFPLLDIDRLPYAICGVSIDITGQLESREEMRRLRANVWHADRVARVGALSVSLAHELNQPLAAILSNAQAALRFLESGKADPQEIREILGDIVRDDKRAATVINSLRSIVRRQATEHVRVDLSEVMQEILGILHGDLLERQIEITTDLEAGCEMLADKGQIQQVILNLVMNAAEAMNDSPRGERHLHLSVSRIGHDMGRITVEDSGEGIPEDGHNKVFDAFRSTKPQGMGLGLSVCRSIVESHGGSIWLEPNDGRGVRACLNLPLENLDGAIGLA